MSKVAVKTTTHSLTRYHHDWKGKTVIAGATGIGIGQGYLTAKTIGLISGQALGVGATAFLAGIGGGFAGFGAVLLAGRADSKRLMAKVFDEAWAKVDDDKDLAGLKLVKPVVVDDSTFGGKVKALWDAHDKHVMLLPTDSAAATALEDDPKALERVGKAIRKLLFYAVVNCVGDGPITEEAVEAAKARLAPFRLMVSKLTELKGTAKVHVTTCIDTTWRVPSKAEVEKTLQNL